MRAASGCKGGCGGPLATVLHGTRYSSRCISVPRSFPGGRSRKSHHEAWNKCLADSTPGFLAHLASWLTCQNVTLDSKRASCARLSKIALRKGGSQAEDLTT